MIWKLNDQLLYRIYVLQRKAKQLKQVSQNQLRSELRYHCIYCIYLEFQAFQDVEGPPAGSSRNPDQGNRFGLQEILHEMPACHEEALLFNRCCAVIRMVGDSGKVMETAP